MKIKSTRGKSVSLVFRGFNCSVDEVESWMDVAASRKGLKGELTRPNAKSTFKRSFVRFSVDLEDTARLNEVISRLIGTLGGSEHLQNIRELVNPEFLEIDLTWPVKMSQEQEGGFFSPDDLSVLASLQCSLSLEFL